MSPGTKLKLGSAALVAQAAPLDQPRQPDHLDDGAEVWAFFRRWRRGRISRILRTNINRITRGTPRGDQAEVRLYVDEHAGGAHRQLSVRRPLAELILASADKPADTTDREEAQRFARDWWAKQNPA